jgi:hypothetical protein
MDVSKASPDPVAARGIAMVAHHGARRSKGGGVLRWPSLDVIFGYRGGVRSGTYIRGLQPVGSSGAGCATARLKLRPSATVAGSNKGQIMTRLGKVGAT